MKINAYILAADPAWLPVSVGSYYEIVNKIIVSYDQDGISWNGTKIDTSEAIERLKKCDYANKMEFRGGQFGRKGYSAMENETFQRQVSISWAAEGADWIMQLDGDEVLPNCEEFLKILGEVPSSIQGIEWPMRVIYQDLGKSKFLEICDSKKKPRYEYPGPIVVRPDAKLIDARRIEGPYERIVVAGDKSSLQVLQSPAPRESRTITIKEEFAVIHFSWARTREQMRSKLGSWGHSSKDIRARTAYLLWSNAPTFWPIYRDFHPFARNLWPRLRLTTIDWQKYSANLDVKGK